jgi:hypothetical protein
LRAWSTLSGWRFESSSAHRNHLLSALFRLLAEARRAVVQGGGNRFGNIAFLKPLIGATRHEALATHLPWRLVPLLDLIRERHFVNRVTKLCDEIDNVGVVNAGLAFGGARG